jgi:AmmeMemoRadiSam system radical SAM enzyme/AmmeMemoRadiSam system protein B/AmmeMemoRadiSam system protein A
MPPDTGLQADGTKAGGWWRTADPAGRIICELCPRACSLKPGDRGFCFVRENRDGRMVLTTYGRSTGFCVDPIEKKPLNHFLPGTSVLSFGTAGCNLGCKFCQNWSISKSREVALLSALATPETIARAAQQLGCHSVAFTYNDPVIWAEYAIDVARACRALGIKTVAVTAGYMTAAARGPFFQVMDAANVDLKAFTESFYRRLTLSHLEPVLETLRWLRGESDVWVEITNLIIPQANDAPEELRRLCEWVLDNLGDEVPLHFSAFHPDFRMQERGRTPHDTLLMAYEIARQSGLKYVYVGNVNDQTHQSTYCPHCGELVIERDWYQLGRYHLQGDRCRHCCGRIAGRFAAAPGSWGRQRLPVDIAQFAPSRPATTETNRRMTMTPTPPVFDASTLSAQQERAIHAAACELVVTAVCRQPAQLTDATLGGTAEQRVMGAFVSLKRRGRLRGCCGFLGQATPLEEALHHAATRTATEDVRLPAVSPTELPYLELDVWLLHRPRAVAALGVQRADEVVIGQHGLYIRQGNASGLLLPSVALDHHLDATGFLQQVCQKANLHAAAWKEDDTHLVTFEGHAISGPFDLGIAHNATGLRPRLMTATDVAQLADHCRTNIAALLQGAMASCYLPGVVDGTVQGVAISVSLPGRSQPMPFSRLSLRPGLPLQSTLYGLAEVAAQSLASQGIDVTALAAGRVALTVLWDAAMHGTVQAPDLDGIDPASRAVLTIEGNRSAWVYHPQQLPQELLDSAAQEARVQYAGSAIVLSLAAASTEPAARVATIPRPQRGPKIRPPAVAGAFYPSDARSLSATLDRLLPHRGTQRASWPAVMVPHAGLQYSGKIAAEVYQHLDIPEVVIVLGPRHTRLGMARAVAPHESWSLPGTTVASDPDLAHQLAEAIPDLHLDAQAHQREHSIEVQLPFLARLAPHSRVVGIVLGADHFDRCRQFASGLAAVLRQRHDKPLLIISSDLNHYASDAENRRLDEIALAALQRLDPADVFETVSRYNISMCGLWPAVVVLETLRQLGTLSVCQQVGYATSADAGGDPRRVVGYAGMLFG